LATIISDPQNAPESHQVLKVIRAKEIVMDELYARGELN